MSKKDDTEAVPNRYQLRGSKFKSKRPKRRARYEPPTPEITQQFCDVVLLGNFRYIARGACGITQAEYAAWARQRKKAEEAQDFDDPCLRFFEAVEEAEAQLHTDLVQDVLETGTNEDRRWFLTRRWNKLYSKNPNAHIDDESGKKEEIDPVEALKQALGNLIDPDDAGTSET